ncbi:hypothetical protein H2200_001563 [Cladophialophora chaetospira]|uniref:Uncharacterized protein n=1 Tax=Cladophialophora chaetospira TaxID=386627 RepID=A0AA39CN55_9EURO|nr:hypothetical protein H2200_001563 [Cladophialophora chaetospira]
MVHADHDEPSFFNNPANQIQQQVLTLYRMAPPTKEEVFEYLDEHPDALQEYLGTLRPACLLGPLSPVFAQEGALAAEAASENEVQDSTTDQGSFVPRFDGEDEDFWQRVAAGEPVGEEVEYEFPLAIEGIDFDVAVVDEVAPQAGPEVPLDNADVNDELDSVVDSDSDNDANGVTPPSSDYEAIDASEADSVDSNVDNTTANTTPVAPTPAAGANPDPNFITYPAPAHLLAASRLQPPSRSWALWEEDACIRHMLDIDRENQLRGEARFHEALRRMRTIDNCTRDRPNAVKNFWNRVGRARSGLDERRNKSAPLATSRQGKQAQAARTNSSSSASRSTTSASRKRGNASSTRRGTRPHTTPIKRRPKTREYSSDEDEESDFPLESDNEEPIHLRHARKRKDHDDDSSEDDWQPTPGYVNAVAKGLRAPKRARTAAAC